MARVSVTEGEDDDASRRFRNRLAERKAPTQGHDAPEIGLWLALRRNDSGLRFRRQHSAGDYVLDFYCAPARLAIEVDGEAHARGDRPVRDAVRDGWLETQGVQVLRCPAIGVLSNLDEVIRHILAIALERQSIFER